METKQAKNKTVVELYDRLNKGLVPDEEIRNLVREEVERRLLWGYKPTHEQQLAHAMNFANDLRKMRIAEDVDRLDSSVYDVPIPFMQLMLGSFLKESCCYFKDNSMTLDEAETTMLELYCERAQLKDGQTVLDLGSGQGPLTLYIAQKFKNCHVTSITNVGSHKEFIEETCKKLNLSNVRIISADISTYEVDETFDRVFVIGLIEHLKNFELLLKKISKWMTKDGLLFIDHLCHKTFPHMCEPIEEDDWFMNYIFPSGTTMIPSASLLLYFQDDVYVMDHWTLSGKHFMRTCEEWQKRLYSNVDAIKATMKKLSYSEEATMKLFNYWRCSTIIVMEWFGYNNGEEWMNSLILFRKK